MRLIIEWARAESPSVVECQVLRQNTTMLAMCCALSFHVSPDPGDPDVNTVRLKLEEHADPV